ncbi:hypothetical protein GCM10010349_13160 [Streptomyces flavofungini]|nr:hypothetical protein GCM10010349_13160 [Streptomyces flavofungini]
MFIGLNRKPKLWGAVSAVVAISAGVAVWQLWPSDAPAVSVPARVCTKSLPADSVSQLLPKNGKRYYEYINGDAGFGAPHRPEEPSPSCNFSGGGRWVSVEYNRVFNAKSLGVWSADEARRKVEKGSSIQGSVPVSLGQSYGYAREHDAVLLLNCRDRDMAGVIEVTVRDEGDFASNESDAKAFAELAADVMRLARKKVYQCDEGATLPSGPPTLGAPKGD